MSKRIRQQDIAKELGLSINTVSLALKNSRRINEETRLKVHQVAQAMNYIPNSIARSLVERKTNIIGFILPKITNPIQIETAQRIERKLLAAGYNMMIMTTDSDSHYEAQALDIMVSRQVDGILMYPTNKQHQDKIHALRNADIPIVLLSGGNYPLATDSVYMNQYAGAYKAVSHLAGLGYQRIAYISDGNLSAEKHKGYEAALKEHGLAYEEDLVVSVKQFNYGEGYRAAAVLGGKGPFRAIFASSDYLALGALRWCREQGLRVPEDVAIVGFDNLEAGQYAEVPLTSVTNKVEEVTTLAVNHLLRLIEEQSKLSAIEPVRIDIEPVLEIRSSCGGVFAQ